MAESSKDQFVYTEIAEITETRIRAAIAAHRNLGWAELTWLARIVLSFLVFLVDPTAGGVLAIALWVIMVVLFLSAVSNCSVALGGNPWLNVALGILIVIPPLGFLIGCLVYTNRLMAFWKKLDVKANVRFGPSDTDVQNFLRDHKAKAQDSGLEHQSSCNNSKVSSEYEEVIVTIKTNDAYISWLSDLDAWLEKSGLPTRSKDFHPEALAYGFANRMDPDSFVKSGYKKRMSDLDLQTYKKLLDQDKQGLSSEADSDEQPTDKEACLEASPAHVSDQPACSADKPPLAVVSDIERLVELYKSGFLSEEEFNLAKSRLLS